MKKYHKEIVKLTVKEILLSFTDLVALAYKADYKFRKSANEYFQEREVDKSHFWSRIAYLRKMGYITTFVEGKDHFIELNPKGIQRLEKISLGEIKIANHTNWDGRWRLVIFDIPDRKRSERDILRRKLIKLRFVKVQESVYVYPFECTSEVSKITKYLSVDREVLILISEIIQGEETLIEKFLSNHVLTKEDLNQK